MAGSYSKLVVTFHIPTQFLSSPSTFLPTLFDLSHSSRCVVVSHGDYKMVTRWLQSLRMLNIFLMCLFAVYMAYNLFIIFLV